MTKDNKTIIRSTSRNTALDLFNHFLNTIWFRIVYVTMFKSILGHSSRKKNK